MGSKFLDYTGLSYYSSLLKNYFMKKGDTADAASKLETARNISLTGDATGSASFDGSEDTSISTTLASSGVTAGSYGPSEDASPEHSGTFSVPYVTVDAKGRVTAASTKTITLPSDNSTDTKVTNTLATTTKAYLTGTTSDTTNTGTQVFDTGVYLGTSAGELHVSGLYLDGGNAILSNTDTWAGLRTEHTDTGTRAIFGVGGDGTTHGVYSDSEKRWLFYSDGSDIHVGSSTVGSATTPIYLASGVPTACTTTLEQASSITLATTGYIKYASGLIIQWGSVSASSGASYTVTFPTAFSSATSYAIVKNHGYNGSSEAADREVSFYDRTSTSATTYNTDAATTEQWIAIGY